MQGAEKFWDKMARRYVKLPIKNMAAYNQTLEHTRARLSPNDRVLELGCGSGMTALLLADAVQQMTASDISGEMIAVGREKAEEEKVANVDFVKGTAFDETFESESYDVVMAFNFLHLVEDTSGTVARIRALLKTDGLFISKTVCLANAGFFAQLMMRLLIPVMQMVKKAPYVRFMTSREVESCITDAGFQIMESRNFTSQAMSRFVVARKIEKR